MNYSFWEKQKIEQASDVTIIGAGIVGLSTALSIREHHPDISIKILERAPHPNGASTKNAGFSCFGSVSELMDDIRIMGEEACMDVVRMRWNGLQRLRQRVGDAFLNYEAVGGTELFRKQDAETRDACLDVVEQCNQLIETYTGLTTCYTIRKNTALSGFEEHSIFNQYEGLLQPVHMMQCLFRQAIANDIGIYYGIEIDSLDSSAHIVKTTYGLHIAYKTLMLCTNGFTYRLRPDLAVVPARNQVLITEPLPHNPLKSGYHVDKGYIYFREYEGRILLGGGRNTDPAGEETDAFGNTDAISNYLDTILETIYPGASKKVAWRWSGILGIGNSKQPIIQWIEPGILAGVRLGGMGVAIGSWLGEQLAIELLKKGL
jgi:glycine/D-amino acid oxidase-like deaminating enzyme